LTLRVGITGHRPNKLKGPAVELVAVQLPLVFSAIDAAAGAILAANSNFYAPGSFAVRLVSGFAEGADQMAVAACPAGWQIEAILPFPKQEYLDDFATSAADDGRDVRGAFEESLAKAHVVTELAFVPGHRSKDAGRRDRAYADAGGFMLRQIDVLIAVWDGKAPKVGGTGALARSAFEGGIPVVWLSTTDNAPPRLITGLGPRGPTTAGADCTKGPLLAALLPIFSVGASAAGRAGRRSARGRLARFLRERWRPRCYSFVYDLLKRIVSLRLPRLVIKSRSLEERRKDWDKFIADAPHTGDPSRGDIDRGNLRSKLGPVLLERYAWADALAEHYAHNYRSAYVVAYLLSAVAVFIALGSAVVASYERAPAKLPSSVELLQSKLLFSGIELVVIVFIVVIVFVGRFAHWHQRWLDYRTLAESLRHGRFLAFVGEFGRIYEPAGHPGGRETPWMLWYFRATMRETGLPTATLDRTYQWRLLQATLEHELQGRDGQIRYHSDNQIIMERIDRSLHYLGLFCFLATFVLLAGFLAGAGVELVWGDLRAAAENHRAAATGLGGIAMRLKPWLMFWTAGLPALGAALAGIRVHGDFEGSKERSAKMADALLVLQDEFARATERDVTLEETSDLLISTAHAMSEDVAAWQELYGRKWLTLPA
jgi:Protein of unknown function (DUF4231)